MGEAKPEGGGVLEGSVQAGQTARTCFNEDRDAKSGFVQAQPAGNNHGAVLTRCADPLRVREPRRHLPQGLVIGELLLALAVTFAARMLCSGLVPGASSRSQRKVGSYSRAGQAVMSRR